jgi:hypothetical protein
MANLLEQEINCDDGDRAASACPKIEKSIPCPCR